MRKTVRALALALALTAPVYAGEMQCPPPQPQQAVQEPTAEGDMHFPLVELALSLFTLL